MSLFDPATKKRIDAWLQGPYDEETKAEIRKQLIENPQSLIDAFYTELSFGTGGLRGIMGVGTNRMNRYTIQITTQGLANYLLKESKGKEPLSVFIGFDSRHNSSLFAQEAAAVLAGNGIAVHLLKELRPTPFISFGCRYKKCSAAIMITASHNPPEYNGYKVYWSDGAQVVPPHDTGIIQEIQATQKIKKASLDDPLIHLIGDELDGAYIEAIRPLQLQKEKNQQKGSSLKIAYTSLHGTGITLVPQALSDWGFSSVHFVKEQITPDGDFPTVKFPNPEYKEALALGIDTLTRTESDLLIATDPDADRLGAVVMHQGKPIILTGNQTASLCVGYLCETLTKQNKMPKKGAFVTTIVTTELLKTIAKAYERPCFEVLTGFKYIGEKIHEWEQSKEGYQFLFGAEESYGYLLGTHARDKDAVVSACLIAEMALAAKEQGLTLVDKLHAIYQKHGLYREKQLSLNFNATKEGMEQMTNLMNRLRKSPPESFCGKAVIAMEDYETGVATLLPSKKTHKLTLPTSDVLLFRLEDESKLIVRPSGTEPKVKVYASVYEKSVSSVENATLQADQRLEKLLQEVKCLTA